MSLERGAIKYAIKSIIYNYSAMYVFGGFFVTLYTLGSNIVDGNFIEIIIGNYVPSLKSIILNPVVGSPIVVANWYRSIKKRQ
ncbi:hypothetical protein Metev_2356 (plasmid) [Methanohalobium evestigatum Z-7303]|uniref:Uncharacterized protein n=1 Tax=Methanohalobium evestigatum (strain ATCC BAA-1072 / DSM 3721 / NBRC 107634 / OCM 161 / Z-7303) TaxID=644295 RepID=D7EC44_METEZ|nr:hypothetical protein [Methanohalobium evestigatum]ADI75166.1 hypothetical protein Metev_2356 [Methanohalobium evestigatum Z-7303]